MARKDKIDLVFSTEDFGLIREVTGNSLPPDPSHNSCDALKTVTCSREQIKKMAEALRWKNWYEEDLSGEELFLKKYRTTTLLYDFVMALV